MSTPDDSHAAQDGPVVASLSWTQEELVQLYEQDQRLTSAMGGTLPEQDRSEDFAWVLDIGCGSGGWLLELAQNDPAAAQLVGIDVQGELLAFARLQADVLGVGDLLEWRELDARGKLDYNRDFFDLVNIRLGSDWLRPADWSRLLAECARVARPTGTVRVSELDPLFATCTSPALARLNALEVEALAEEGQLFSADAGALLPHLERLLTEQDIEQIQTRPFSVAYHTGEPLLLAGLRARLTNRLPFLRHWSSLEEAELMALYEQAQAEMRQADFRAEQVGLTVWGRAASGGGGKFQKLRYP